MLDKTLFVIPNAGKRRESARQERNLLFSRSREPLSRARFSAASLPTRFHGLSFHRGTSQSLAYTKKFRALPPLPFSPRVIPAQPRRPLGLREARPRSHDTLPRAPGRIAVSTGSKLFPRLTPSVPAPAC